MQAISSWTAMCWQYQREKEIGGKEGRSAQSIKTVGGCDAQRIGGNRWIESCNSERSQSHLAHFTNFQTSRNASRESVKLRLPTSCCCTWFISTFMFSYILAIQSRYYHQITLFSIRTLLSFFHAFEIQSCFQIVLFNESHSLRPLPHSHSRHHGFTPFLSNKECAAREQPTHSLRVSIM